tara:strand:+ start:265 stop:618 length:354 start_codon:yes stop_codon:yes gene_type:complete
MHIQHSFLFQLFLFFILVVKFFYLITLLVNLYDIRIQKKTNKPRFKNLQEKLHNIFIICMGIVLVMLFHPFQKEQKITNRHVIIYLFIFGLLSISNIIKIFVQNKQESTEKRLLNYF